jgi:hypothetical protein
MTPGIDFQRHFIEAVFINLPGPEDPEPGMTGGELLQGFLAGLINTPNQELRNQVLELCQRWNVVYRQKPEK